MADNFERLQEEGVIRTPMPDEYEAVIRGLSDEEADVLISVRRRLEEARVSIDAEEDHYTRFLPF